MIAIVTQSTGTCGRVKGDLVLEVGTRAWGVGHPGEGLHTSLRTYGTRSALAAADHRGIVGAYHHVVVNGHGDPGPYHLYGTRGDLETFATIEVGEVYIRVSRCGLLIADWI